MNEYSHEYGTYFVVRDMNWYMMKSSSNLSLYSLDSTSCIGISQPKNTHISPIFEVKGTVRQY